MLVYGDRPRREDPRAKLCWIGDALRLTGALPSGIVRHAGLVEALIEAGELAQGLADTDESAPATDAAMALTTAIARLVVRSWDSGFTTFGDVPDAELDAVASAALPDAITTKEPEGYAYYALYPEAFLEAARSIPWRTPPRIVGIRSIGTSLAAIVAAAVGASVPITVRPHGHPFGRTVSLPRDVVRDVAALHAAEYAIVDEGPGLSGSSFAAVASALEEAGARPDRIRFFPSHLGEPGPEASGAVRGRWATTPRHAIGFDALALGTGEPAHRLESWVRDLVGDPIAPLRDISGGGWRAQHFGSEADWPAAHLHQERRKFLLHTADGTWLLKFSGLGRTSAHKLARARLMADQGFGIETAGIRHGFLVQRWATYSRPLTAGAVERGALVREVGRYLGTRARVFPAEPDRGASLATLLAMARHNAAEGLGEAAATPLGVLEAALPRLEGVVRRVMTDNRLQAWEWLVMADGALVKTDALDHCHAHDLVGCQDVAWDVAGAVIELGLNAGEAEALAAAVERESGMGVERELVAFLRPCYLAFQLGSSTMAEAALAGLPAEAGRHRAARRRYSVQLETELAGLRDGRLSA